MDLALPLVSYISWMKMVTDRILLAKARILSRILNDATGESMEKLEMTIYSLFQSKGKGKFSNEAFTLDAVDGIPLPEGFGKKPEPHAHQIPRDIKTWTGAPSLRPLSEATILEITPRDSWVNIMYYKDSLGLDAMEDMRFGCYA